MSKKHKHVSTFSLEGRFLSFILEDGYKIKHLCMATAEGELWIKLSKEARASVNGVLTSGSWIGVVGEKLVDLTTGEVKYKAFLINQAVPRQGSNPMVESLEMPLSRQTTAEKSKAQRPATILMCQKSDCMKRGEGDLSGIARNLKRSRLAEPSDHQRHRLHETVQSRSKSSYA